MFVVTFYSYKGGVGRTSALMNTAYRLARRRKKVLIVDFDLEAPGVDAFRECSTEQPRRGIVEYISAFLKKGTVPAVKDFVYRVGLPQGAGEILLLPAGRKDREYQADLSRLDWKVLYKQKKGFLFIENLKAGLKQEFMPDYVLVDSRTGLTDTSGICTLQLPSLVVLLFSLNNQNLQGTGQIFRSIRFNKLNRPISTLLVASPIPEIPDFVGVRKDRLEFARKIVGAPADLVLPYDAFMSFEEKIVMDQDSKTPLGESYDALADRIISANPGDVLTMLQEARQLREKGNSELAELRFQEIVESKPESFEGWLEYGTFARTRGRYADSAKYLERALELVPDHREALAQLSSTYLAMKRTGPASDAFHRLLRVSTEKDGELIAGLAYMFVRAGLLEPAKVGYLSLIKRGGAINNYVLLGEIFMREKDHQRAVDVYKAGLEVQPTNLVCTYNVGHALERLGDFAGAREYYQKAIELFERMDRSMHTPIWLANAQAAIAIACAGMGKYEKALQMIANSVSTVKSVEKSQIFSPITYRYVSKEEFMKDLDVIGSRIRERMSPALRL